MVNPKVSIVIPAYNAKAYLPETIASVEQQSYQDFEVLVVNDGSTDDTAQWCSSLANPRITLINQNNQGCAAARNRGIDAAKGQYIAFLDADDIWEPRKLEKQVHILESCSKVGLVNTWIANIDAQGHLLNKLGVSNVEGDVWESVIEENPIMCGSAPIIRRQCFDSVGLFDQNLRSAEDWDMWIRIAKKYEFAVVKEPLVRYRLHANSKSHNLQLHLQSRLKVIEKAFQDKATDQAALKDRAYGLAYLSVAYRALQIHDFDTALTFRQRSLHYCPQLANGKVFQRLGLILFLRRYLGNRLYEQLLKGLQKTKALFMSPSHDLLQNP